MVSYSSKTFISLFTFSSIVLFSPSKISHRLNLSFPRVSIKADRNSPAFSAIEDVYTLKNKSIQIDTDEEGRILIKKKKLKLKALKISLHEHQEKENKKLETLVMRGETIDVSNFTQRFLENKETSRVRLSAFQPSWNSKVGQNKKSSRTELKEGEKLKLASGVVISKKVASADLYAKESVPQSKVAPLFAQAPKLKWLQEKITYQPEIIKGKVDLDGFGFREEAILYLERRFGDDVYEAAAVEGLEFQLEVGELRGFVSAELRNLKGEVLAYGEKNLENHKLGKDFNIDMKLSEGLFTGRALEGNSLVEQAAKDTTHAITAAEGNLEADSAGYFASDLFAKGSQFISTSKGRSYWPSLNISESGRALYPKLFKKEEVELLALNVDPFGERIEIENAIIGQVAQMGLARQGLKVQIYGQEFQKPIYFSKQVLPNPNLKQTSSNGKFIFVNINQGAHLVQVIDGQNKVLSQKWFIVKKGHISEGRINIGEPKKLLFALRSFPERSSENHPKVIFSEIGSEDYTSLNKNKEAEIKSLTSSDLTAYRVDKQEDLKQHIFLSPTKAVEKEFMVFSSTWLSKLLNYRRVNVNPSLALIVGKMDVDFEILSETSNILTQSSEVIYFDRDGNFTENGRAGGGFVIANAALGFRTLTLKQKDKKEFLSRLLLSESNSVSVF